MSSSSRATSTRSPPGRAARAPAPVLPGSEGPGEWLPPLRAELPAGITAFEALDDAHLPLMRKDDSDDIARRAGVKVPWSRIVTTAAELEDAAGEAPYPAVLKPVFP